MITRRKQRQLLLIALGPKPAWYRPFMRRRWRQAFNAIMTLDTYEYDQILRNIYEPEEPEHLVGQHNPLLQLVREVDKK